MKKTLTKKKVIETIARKHGMHVDDVRIVLQDFLDCIAKELSMGNRFEFRGFGVFETVFRKSKVGRNPKVPDKAVPIPARRAVKFSPGKKLKKIVESHD